MKQHETKYLSLLHDRLLEFHRNESAATATEYLILLILIACAVIFMVKTFGKSVSDKFWQASETVEKELAID